MASGKTHDKINVIFICLFILALFFYNLVNDYKIIYFLLGFLIGTFFLGPDLDLKSNLYYRWGYLRMIWHPYQKNISHRSLWSHMPVLSDILRLLWVFAFYILFFLSPYFIFTFFNQEAFVKLAYFITTVFSLLLLTVLLIKSKQKVKFKFDFGMLILVLYLLNTIYVFTYNHPFFLPNFKLHSIKDTIDTVIIIALFSTGTVLATTLHAMLDILYSGMKKLKKH